MTGVISHPSAFRAFPFPSTVGCLCLQKRACVGKRSPMGEPIDKMAGTVLKRIRGDVTGRDKDLGDKFVRVSC